MKIIMADCLRRFLNKNDRMTYEHSLRLAHMARIMTEYFPDIQEADKEAFVAGCCIHDIGKGLIPNDILHKPSILTAEEWRMMRRHPELGLRMLKIQDYVHKPIVDIVQFHHERWDGLGYPYQLRGDDIPIWARLCSILDAYDSMVTHRPYRRGMSAEKAREELRRQRGAQFDPDCVDLFHEVPSEAFETATEFCETYPMPGSSVWKRCIELDPTKK